MNAVRLRSMLSGIQNQLEAMNIYFLDSGVVQNFMKFALAALEDKLKREQLTELITVNNLDGNICEIIILAYSEILWELAKNVYGDIFETFENSASQQSPKVNELFQLLLNFYRDNLERLQVLQDAFGISAPRYEDFTWRLDFEFSRRSVPRVRVPVFQIQLDTSTESHQLQGDYSSINHICSELERAVDEFNSVHCQRLMHYL